MRKLLHPIILLLLLTAACAHSEEMVTVTGTVVDLAGKPAGGARVRAIVGRPYTDEASVKDTVVAGADGVFSFSMPVLEPQSGYDPKTPEYEMVADTPDGQFGWVGYVGQPGHGRLPADFKYRIEMSLLTAVDGTVVGTDGRGIAGVEVSADEFTSSDGRRCLRLPLLGLALASKTAISGEDGSFRLDGVPQGVRVHFQAKKDGLAFKGATSVYGSTLAMIPTGSVAGRAVDSEGRPVAAVTVHASASYKQPGDPPGIICMRSFVAGSGSAKTSSDGSYVIRGLNTIRFDLRTDFASNLLAKEIENVDVAAGQTTKVRDLVALPTAVIMGRVKDAKTNQPIKHVTVSVEDSAGWRRVSTDESGAYSTRVLPEIVKLWYAGGNEDYLLDVDAHTYVHASVSGTPSMDIYLDRADLIKGKVIDAAGNPVDRATVKLGSVYRSYSPDWTDIKGMFDMRVSPERPLKPHEDSSLWQPGMLVICAESLDHTQGVVAQAKREDMIKGAESLKLSPAQTLTVIVKDEKGSPLPGVSVNATSLYGFFGRSVATDESGQARLEGLYVGDNARLSASLKDYRTKDDAKLAAVGSKDWKDTVEVTMRPATERELKQSAQSRRIWGTLNH